MLGGIGSYGSAASALMTQQFSRLDSDSSGTISQEEFVAGRPDGVSSDQASALYSALDSEGSGELSASDLASAFQQLSGAMQTTMLQAQESAQQGGAASDLFATLDSDGDGSLTREEFLAGKPDDVSDTQAEALWNDLSGGSDSIDEADFASAAPSGPAAGGPGGPGGAGGPPPSDDSDDTSTSVSPLDTNGDGVVSEAEFLAGKPEAVTDQQAQDLWSALSGGSDSLSTQDLAAALQPPMAFAQAASAYAATAAG
ncbi:Ca2+-binding protein, EF-hand superfamily [Tistlia consotensis]|uniref:Ca2+-binding protein, EF-hand superfamily n=1 Tax=Tistlia consotensis USBA 355 TaxID=560819 RepID=A0A1Y6BNN2_9PROT|nr:EF-hand domain-containing protein [Tistlia consotensis]SMF13127.1 Ca2+-binding protein, EF-hand superfamily [Tistlia consotensis USBA 355]SNR50703.1 Ca2+-binding protein, EF-hand superfamily [Tistlia consotensis]